MCKIEHDVLSFNIPRYGKYVRKRTVLQIHDETNDSHAGDRVEIAECRPVSRTKRWALVRIVERAPMKAELVYGETVKAKDPLKDAGKPATKTASKTASKSAPKKSVKK